MPSFAQSRAERLSDRDVKVLIAQVDEGRDKFEGNLDGQFKGGTLRGANGDVKVSAALQDYQDSTKKLQERYTPAYAAGPEVATVLKQSTLIDAFMLRSAANMKGRSEWDRQVVNLKHLAQAYGTAFPLAADGVAAHRMNDPEVAGVADKLVAAAGRFKNDLDKAVGLAKPEKEAGKKDVDLLIDQAKAVKSRAGDGKPATGELQQLVGQAARVQSFATAHPNLPTANWQQVQSSIVTLRQAFGLAQ